ncbi:Sortase family protein [Thermoleophilum album]|uniref:Sortase family protein n=2 Tax=Thermoleophilum album TaxID=29539 RepID=A0A1H6G046_THEAL|nr:Sortase family protein [Thermoleophilum album]
MITSGCLLLADAVVTVVWQEPISAVLAAREQQTLERQLRDPRVVRRVIARRPLPGDAIGRIRFPSLGEAHWVVEGTGLDDLRKGPGHYPETALPGRGRTVAIAGHRTTHGAPFRHLDSLRRGQRVIVDMPYGTFVYRVQRTQIVDPDAFWILRNVGYERLVLSACHPLYSAAQRIVVFARLVARRPPVIKQQGR